MLRWILANRSTSRPVSALSTRYWQPLLLALALLCGSATSSAATLLVLGDSLSASYGIPSDKGWVALLSQRLRQSRPDIDVVNASISGETTDGGLARLPRLLQQHQPTWLIIELGGNDGLRGFPIARLRDNLAQLVALSQQSGAEVLLIGIKIPPNYGKRYTDAFYTSFSDLAKRQELAFVPLFLDNVATKPNLMQADGIHPTAAAQAIMLDNVWPYLTPLLRR